MINYGIAIEPIPSEMKTLRGTISVGIVGTAIAGSAELNKLYLVRSQLQAKQLFGEPSQDNPADLSNCISILQRYECRDILVIKVGNGTVSNGGGTVADAIGGVVSGVRKGVELFKDSFSLYQINPIVILAPKWSDSKALAEKILAISEKTKSIYIANTPETFTVQGLVAAKSDNSLNASLRHPRLAIATGYLLNSESPNLKEPLSVHLAGILNGWDVDSQGNGYGRGISNRRIIGANQVFGSLSMSMEDPDSDTEILTKNGFLTVNRRQTEDNQLTLVGWGLFNQSRDVTKEIESSNFFITTLIQDRINRDMTIFSARYIGYPPILQNIQILEKGLERTLELMASNNFIFSNVKVMYLEAESNLATGLIAFENEFVIRPSISLIKLKPQMLQVHQRVQINFGG